MSGGREDGADVVVFFKQAGYTNAFTVKAILSKSPSAPLQYTADPGIASLKIVGVLITFIVADRFGRRFMVLICSWAAWSMLIVVAASGAYTSNPAIAKLAVAGACLWAVPSGARESTQKASADIQSVQLVGLSAARWLLRDSGRGRLDSRPRSQSSSASPLTPRSRS